ncbi:MAG: GyrI-like domain-containing protein [Bacteroidota bacterium]
MKVLKTLGFLILGLVALLLIIGAFQPTHVEYKSSTDINASKDIIFSKINDLKAWEEWGPWKEEDPTIQMTYGEKTEGIGASYNWTSELSGDGKVTITESDAPTWQNSAIEFDGQGGSNGWFKLEDGENGATKSYWGFSMDIPYPWNAMLLFTGASMKKQMDKMLESGLSNLKAICEKEATEKTYRGFAVKPMEFPGQTYLVVNGTVNFADMQAFYTNSYGDIGNAIGSQKLETAGQPCGIYYKWDEETKTTDMAAAIPVKGNPTAVGNVEPYEVPKGRCVMIDHYGDYEGLGEAHGAMDDYLKANGMEPAKLVMEEYVTDPGNEPDPAKWLTKIYYFLDGPLASEK